jgi:hypothetical protein
MNHRARTSLADMWWTCALVLLMLVTPIVWHILLTPSN